MDPEEMDEGERLVPQGPREDFIIHLGLGGQMRLSQPLPLRMSWSPRGGAASAETSEQPS